MKKVTKLFIRNKDTGDIEDVSDYLYRFEEEGMRELEGFSPSFGGNYEVLAVTEGVTRNKKYNVGYRYSIHEYGRTIRGEIIAVTIADTYMVRWEDGIVTEQTTIDGTPLHPKNES